MSDLETRVEKLLFKWLNDKHLPQGIRPGMKEDLVRFVTHELANAQERQISERMSAQKMINDVPPTQEVKDAQNS